MALAPTSIATRAVSKVAPRPIAGGFRRVANLSPTAIVARRALAISRSRPAARSAPVSAPPVRGGFFGQISRLITHPTAAPSSGQMVSPAVVQAAAAVTAPSYGGGGYDDDGGSDTGADDTDEAAAQYAPDQGDDDQGDEEIEGLGDVDYVQALADAGLGDWSTDLKNFGVTAGKTVASQALTTIGQKLGGGGATYKPPAPAPMSTATKVAIGAAIALPVGYLVLRRRPA